MVPHRPVPRLHINGNDQYKESHDESLDWLTANLEMLT
jgi:hypothetical protein